MPMPQTGIDPCEAGAPPDPARITRAGERVMVDLINALFLENAFGVRDRGGWTESPPELSGENRKLLPGEGWFQWPLSDGSRILFRARRQNFLHPVRISRPPVWHAAAGGARPLKPSGVVRLLAVHTPEGERGRFPNLEGFCSDLEIAVEHEALSSEGRSRFAGEPARPDSLTWAERLASLRDRPFHPTARAKTGWNREDYRRYSPEFGRTFGLDWVAVRRENLRAGSGPDSLRMAERLLPEEERDRLRIAAEERGVKGDDWVFLPVHPWQMEHVLPRLYREELDRGLIRLADRNRGRFVPTSSLRTLVPQPEGTVHVKLPLGIASLGALRILPPRYMENGEKGQRLLGELIRHDPLLRERLLLCREENWCAWSPSEGDPFADKPGHLACQLREIPAVWQEDPACRPVPMSALAVGGTGEENPAVRGLLRERSGSGHGPREVLDFFREVADRLVETGLCCARYGVMPEMHGQNVVMVFRRGRPERLLLRDHDTLRVHPPWLRKAGLPDPGYTVKPGTPNTLILREPEEMLAYFQTLAVQVNLYAVADTLGRTYGLEEIRFWRIIRETVKDVLSRMFFPKPVKAVLERALLDSSTWPTKWLITPLLKREGTGGGSMPSEIGRIPNPLREPEPDDDGECEGKR